MKNFKLMFSLLLAMMGISSTKIYTQDVEIVDCVASRDAETIKSMFSNNWQWLGMKNSEDTDFIDQVCSIQDFSWMNDAEDTDFVDYTPPFEGFHYKVLRVDNVTVGFIAYDYSSTSQDANVSDSIDGYIAYVVIDNNYHHNGYGDQLMQYAINDMRAHGVTEVSLCTRTDNVVARNLYENKLGFQVEEEQYIDLVLHLA